MKKNPFDEFMALLDLERLDENLFRGPSRDVGTNRVFGGQVLGQALKATQHTVDNSRFIHSLHAYFLREGDHNAPIIYEVDRSRDGRSFSSRRVVAIQHGRPIFTMAASFQVEETGLSRHKGGRWGRWGVSVDVSKFYIQKGTDRPGVGKAYMKFAE